MSITPEEDTYSASASTLATAALQITSKSKYALSVDHTDGQLVSTLEDLSSLLSRDVVSDLGAVGVVVHHQQLQVSNVAHDELVESVGEHVLGGGSGAVTNVGHDGGTTEAASAASINTLGLSPVLLHKRLGISFNRNQKRTFILLNLSAWKRGKETVLFFTILTLRTGAIAIYKKCECRSLNCL